MVPRLPVLSTSLSPRREKEKIRHRVCRACVFRGGRSPLRACVIACLCILTLFLFPFTTTRSRKQFSSFPTLVAVFSLAIRRRRTSSKWLGPSQLRCRPPASAIRSLRGAATGAAVLYTARAPVNYRGKESVKMCPRFSRKGSRKWSAFMYSHSALVSSHFAFAFAPFPLKEKGGCSKKGQRGHSSRDECHLWDVAETFSP